MEESLERRDEATPNPKADKAGIALEAWAKAASHSMCSSHADKRFPPPALQGAPMSDGVISDTITQAWQEAKKVERQGCRGTRVSYAEFGSW